MSKRIPNSVELMELHLESNAVKSEDITVFHEKKSEIVHSDIYLIRPAAHREFNVIVTCGMSAMPMRIPKDSDALEYAEVMMLLPGDWPLDYPSFKDEHNFWPIRILIELSKLPHRNKTWLGLGHTFEQEREFVAGVGFNSVVLLESLEMPSQFTTIKEAKIVGKIYSVVPLYPEELAFKKASGTGELLKRFDNHGIGEVVKLGRVNTCT